jgi:putative glutamine amidotransferase
MQPLVLITSIPRTIETPLPDPMPNATVNQQLAWLVAAARGLPVAVDSWSDPEALLERIDGIVINGGVDVDPATYGAERHPRTEPGDPRRDRFELELARHAMDRGIPVLGICRGMHILNVARGGTLLQHLPDEAEIEHNDRLNYARPVHGIRISAASRIAAAMGGASAEVNSIHHQGIDRLGAGLTATARAEDGTLEAIEGEGGRFIGIQWHPEFLDRRWARRHVPLFRVATR